MVCNNRWAEPNSSMNRTKSNFSYHVNLSRYPIVSIEVEKLRKIFRFIYGEESTLRSWHRGIETRQNSTDDLAPFIRRNTNKSAKLSMYNCQSDSV